MRRQKNPRRPLELELPVLERAPSPAARLHRLPPVARRASPLAGRLRLPATKLSWKCDPRQFPFRSTREVTPLKGLLGQERALSSLRLGLSVQGAGYNLFVCGLNGAESLGDIEAFIRGLRLPSSPTPDRVYVQNFRDPQRPLLLELPGGRGERLQTALVAVLRRLQRVLQKSSEKRWRARAIGILNAALPRLEAQFPFPPLRRWLSDWHRSLVENLQTALLEDYEANHLRVGRGRGMPVVVERIPTPANLIGWIGRRTLGEQPPAPHFTEIRAGALLEASGGVLVINAADFYSAHGAWNLLKASLKYGTLQIEEADPGASSRSSGLRPEPIALQTKVVLLGGYDLYDELFETDPDFREVFKIRVDFDSETNLTPSLLRNRYPALVSRIARENNLRPVTARGVGKVVDFAVRKAGRKRKITLQSWAVADLLREADYWAREARRRQITHHDVHRALEEGVLRLNLLETKISEMISEGTILISTAGMRVGQVNGLAIYDVGDYQFGKPSRITAETAYGHGGIINIERESGLSGRSHDKGVQILAGFLRSRFAQDRPLHLTASVCFEQSYSGVDGDSASASEIYAILSSLSGLAVRQDIAVTGSMNQKGDIQPIGGVNEKIEGFFDCVQAGRPTGKEGVIVPSKNVDDLLLREDVVEAVRAGRFHVYAIRTVEEGFEILTGVPSGRRGKRGRYPRGTSFDRVDQRLEEISRGLRHFAPGQRPL